MSARDLIHGPYSPPRVSVGDSIICQIRGELRVHSWSDRGAIMWPLGIREGKSPGRPSLVLTGDLVRAVETESAIAVARHWGTTWRTVRVWRRALGVGRMTEGSRRLAVELGRPDMAIESEKGTAASLLPESRKRRDAAHSTTIRGRKPHPNTIEASRRAHQTKRWRMRVAAKNRLRALDAGKPLTTHDPERLRRALEMLAGGATLAEVAGVMNITKQAVDQLLRHSTTRKQRVTGKSFIRPRCTCGLYCMWYARRIGHVCRGGR